MTSRQPSWTKYESAILLEAVISTFDGLLSRSDAIKDVSSTLRKMAVNQGIEIDETYRNENGISFQMHSMESAYYGKTIFKPATKMFVGIVNLYRNSPNEYQKLLKEAKEMTTKPTTVENSFMNYLSKKVSPIQLSEISTCYSEIESFCKKLNILRDPLFQTTDVEVIKKVLRTIEQNKFFRITHKKQYRKIMLACRHYYAYIKEQHFSADLQKENNMEESSSVTVMRGQQLEQNERTSVQQPLVRTEQDKRLYQKYPALYLRLQSSLSELSGRQISIGKLNSIIGNIARSAEIEEILDNSSWAKSNGNEYSFFSDIVNHDIDINEDLREEATTALNGNNAQQFIADSSSFEFYLFNTLGMANATCQSYVSAINNCETFAREHHLDSWQLYSVERTVAEQTISILLSNKDFQEYNTRQHNRFSAALQKFHAFISDHFPSSMDSVSESENSMAHENKFYRAVLNTYFTKGFRMESPLEIRKFRRYYSNIHGTELSDSDDMITSGIKAMCIIYDEKAFLPEVMLSEEIRSKLFEYIESSFAGGKSVIYYQAIYDAFHEDFLDQHIHNADMLKAYLTATGIGRFYTKKDFISNNLNVTLDPLSEISSCLIEYGRPVECDELFRVLPHLPKSKIKSILANNVEFVNNGQGAYFHEKILHLSEEELEGISEIISQTIADKDFISGNELYDAIKAKYSYIIDEHRDLSIYGFRDALKAKLGNKFSFKGNIISEIGHELSMYDIFAKYARTHDNFTLSELKELASNLATVIYFDAVYENSLRINNEQFVSKNMAQFSIEDTDIALNRICSGKYIPIHEVTNFAGFPYAGFTWNSFLLEHYVANYSRKFKILHTGFNGTECVGAIVRRTAGIDSFDDLIVDIIVNNTVEMKKESVLQFLTDSGYLARRRYSEIESLLIKAKAQKQRKDED